MFKRSDRESNEKRKKALINCDPIEWRDVINLTERIAYKLIRGQSHYGADLDLAPKTIYLAWKNIGNYDPSYPLQGWIATIAQRTMIDDIRRRNAKSRRSLGERIGDIYQVPDKGREEKSEIYERIPDLITEMREKEKDLLEHIYVRGFTLEQYASLQKIPIGTAKSRLNRILEKMRKKLTAERLCNQ